MEERRCYGCMNMTSEKACRCGYEAGKENDIHQLPTGTVLKDRYLIGQVLGQGGFGITYLGWDQELQQRVAIKEFYPSSIVNRDHTVSLSVRVNTRDMSPGFENSLERFIREGKTLEKLKDIPEIVDILDSFRYNGTAYIIMEYVSGLELKEYVRRRGGRLTMEETLRILGPVMLALAKVHRENLIHRDVSPDNIILHPTGGAKLLDFGAVRSVDHPDANEDLSHSTETIVKRGFAPVEQYRARGNTGPWSDEYAFCATIYFCLTGQIPPDAISLSTDEEELSWDMEGLTQKQRAALEKGMSFRAKDRFGSLEKLYQELTDNSSDGDPQDDKLILREKKHDKTNRHSESGKGEKRPGELRKKSKQSGRKALLLLLAALAIFTVVLARQFGQRMLLDSVPTDPSATDLSALDPDTTSEPYPEEESSSETASAETDGEDQTNEEPVVAWLQDGNGTIVRTMTAQEAMITCYPDRVNAGESVALAMEECCKSMKKQFPALKENELEERIFHLELPDEVVNQLRNTNYYIKLILTGSRLAPSDLALLRFEDGNLYTQDGDRIESGSEEELVLTLFHSDGILVLAPEKGRETRPGNVHNSPDQTDTPNTEPEAPQPTEPAATPSTPPATEDPTQPPTEDETCPPLPDIEKPDTDIDDPDPALPNSDDVRSPEP